MTPKSSSQRLVSGQVATAASGDLLEIQILSPSRPTEPEALRIGPGNLCFIKPFR